MQKYPGWVKYGQLIAQYMTIFASLYIYYAQFSSSKEWQIMLGSHLVSATLHMKLQLALSEKKGIGDTRYTK